MRWNPLRIGKKVGNINVTQWNRILELAPLVSLSPSQRMSHLFLLYRTYYTPLILFRFGRRSDSSCPRCGDLEAVMLHMFWRCPKRFRYWTGVLEHIDRVFGTSTELEAKRCLVGLVGDGGKLGNRQIAVMRCLFQARNPIARRWQSAIPRPVRNGLTL